VTGVISGVILKGVGGVYTVAVLSANAEADSNTYTCTARGVFRNRKTTPLVGDRAEIEITNSEKKIGIIHTILPRENELRRPPAANINQVIITVSTTNPPFNAGLLDRFLLMVEHESIPILICVNKIDLSSMDAFEPYEKAGYPVVYACALSHAGLERLREKMRGKLNLFAGPSGVGKSSLINALSPGINLETGSLSAKTGRGKHTTRHTEIFPLGPNPEDGFCFDTPGFTSLDISHIQKNELAPLFREFRPFSPSCKFSDCRHHHETDCAVKAQVGKSISPERYESYIKLRKAVTGGFA